jgi:hypothetical protein
MTLQPHWNKWIVSDVWVDIVNNRYDIADGLKFSSKELIAAASRNKVCKSNNIETALMSNPMGFCKACWCKRQEEHREQIGDCSCLLCDES